MRRVLLLCLLISVGCEDKLKDLPAGFVVPEDINRSVESDFEGDSNLIKITYPDKDASELADLTTAGLREAGWTIETIEREGTAAVFYAEKGEVNANAFISKLASGARLDITFPATRPPKEKAKTPAPKQLVDAGVAIDAATKTADKVSTIDTANAGARTYFEELAKGCDGGDEVSQCWLLGIAHERGLGGLPKNEIRAADLYKKGCAPPGRATSCLDHYKRLDKLSDDELSIVSRLCEMGRPDACEMLLAHVEKRTIKDMTPARARAAACEAGSIEVCVKLKKQPKDASKGKKLKAPRRASKLAKAAFKKCNKRVGYACGLLALGYNSGLYGLKRDRKKAIEIGQRACNGKTVWGCYPTAAAAFTKARKTRQMVASLKIAEAGCSRFEPQSCGMLAQVYESDDSQPALRSQAVSYRLMNCHFGLPKGDKPCEAFERSVAPYPKAVPRKGKKRK